MFKLMQANVLTSAMVVKEKILFCLEDNSQSVDLVEREISILHCLV